MYRFPPELQKPQNKHISRTLDPNAHLGLVGYTRNSYQFSGKNLEENNLRGNISMKKTAWLEEMRRRCIAEKHGISPDVDEGNLCGTSEAYRVRTAPKNKYVTYREGVTFEKKNESR